MTLCLAVNLSKTSSLVGHDGIITDISTGREASWIMSASMDGLVKVTKSPVLRPVTGTKAPVPCPVKPRKPCHVFEETMSCV
jgi:hypothetical protein